MRLATLLTALMVAGCAPSAHPAAPLASGDEARPDEAIDNEPFEIERRLTELARRSPRDPDLTPGLLLRLSAVRARLAESACEGERAPADCPDYRAARAPLERLLSEHPDAPEATLALEPLGFFLSQDPELRDAALGPWLALVCPGRATPPPWREPVIAPRADELAACAPRADATTEAIFLTWLRVGEALFEAPDGLEGALGAYDRALAIAQAEHSLRPVAAYERAWTLYRLDRFADALEAFAILAGDARLGAEALQYMAIVATEEDWNDDGQPDAPAGLARPEVARFVDGTFEQAPELLFEIAQTLVDMARGEEAICAYDRFLARFGAHRRADDARRGRARARGLLLGGGAGFVCGVGAPTP
jgi:tetratricopeptide (TPR) repeat protein